MISMDELMGRLSPAQRAALDDATQRVHVAPGDDLTDLLSVHRAMCVVLSGEVEVLWEGHPTRRVGRGGILGEIELFDDAWRDAEVRAVGAGVLWAVSPSGYAQLQDEAPAAARAVERGALESLAARVRGLAEQLAELTHPPRLVRPVSDACESPGRPVPAGRSRIAEALAQAPAFAGAPMDALARLVNLLHPLGYGTGDVMIAAGSDGGGMYMLASGTAEATVPSAAGGAVLLSSLEPGDLTGVVGCVDRGSPPIETTCTAPCVALELEHADFERLCQGADALAAAMRVAGIRSLIALLARGNATWTASHMLSTARRA